MDPKPCTVTNDAGTWPGWVLAWRNTDTGWRALVRYGAPHESGHMLQRERWMPAEALAER
jgi:hypothetical protein